MKKKELLVPDVKITDLYYSNMGSIAREQSKQLKVRRGSFKDPSWGFG